MGNYCCTADPKEGGASTDNAGNSLQNVPAAASLSLRALPAHEPSTPTSRTLSFSANINFTYEELERATNGFADANFLGEGSFGRVYKGVLRDEREVAIKHLRVGSRQGDREFQAEVEIITRVHHRHLVSLVGYSIAGNQLMLVYDFVPNQTLKSHLHGRWRPTMEWPTRQKIAVGTAKGLEYLHEQCQPRIIHRDIKSANILLDSNWEAKIADFGLARIFPDNDTHIEASAIAGTFGYFAPEYASSGELTDKSDVFSFGVVLLELITGRMPVIRRTESSRPINLVDWVTPFLEVGNYDGVVDPRLMGRYNNDEMMRLIKCAAACIRHKPERRPKMNKVVLVLTGNASVDILRAGTAPAERSNRNMEQPLVALNRSNSRNGTSEYSGSVSSYVSISLREQEANEDSGLIQSTQPEQHRLASQRQQSQRRQDNIHGATV